MRFTRLLTGLAAALGLAGCVDEVANPERARAEGEGDVAVGEPAGARGTSVSRRAEGGAGTSPATARLLDDERPVRVATATFALG